jgi:hypothetical protein
MLFSNFDIPIIPAGCKQHDCCKQGDQIGLFFAFWAIVFFAYDMEMTEWTQAFWSTFSHSM